MKALGYTGANITIQPVLFEQATPSPTEHDLLVNIEAIAVNPVDTKVKARLTSPLENPKILGWDAMGTVEAVGDEVTLFKPGEKVFYAGDITRPGCFASHQLVDERIVGRAPTSLSPTEIAVMPLTSITAWEALFSRLKIIAEQDVGKNILIIGGAGGVGSIAIQLAKVVARLNVVTTASRPESEQWCKQLGADHIINHRSDLIGQYRNLGIADPDYILCLNNTDQHFLAMAELIAPQGMICSIVETTEKHDLDSMKSKSAGFVWEFMFTRPMFTTQDMIAQHHLLNTISQLLDEGKLKSTLTKTIGPLSADNLNKALQQLIDGSVTGKLAMTALT